MSKTKVVSLTDSKIRIIGDNLLYINGDLIAYYIIPLTNYSVVSLDGSLHAIESLTSLLSTFASQKKSVEFSLQRFSKLIQSVDVIKNLYSTIKLYNEDYDMPVEFTKRLQNNTQDFCLLGVKIDTKEADSIEDSSIIETAKSMFTGAINSFLSSEIGLDEEKILQYEKNIYNTLRVRCLRATKELVFYNYISKLYPNYSISYDEMSYINEENFSNILGSVTQVVEDNFGYFIMHNTGVDFFDLEPQDSYGCILSIKNFPATIHSESFSMDYPGMQVNIKTLDKDQAKLRLKRQRATEKWNLEEALKAGAEMEQLEETASAIDIATNAIAEIEANGTVMCEFNADILITSFDRDDLKRKIQLVHNDLKDRDILAAKSLTQGMDFLNHYVKLISKKYTHMSALQYPLSFQLNSGSLVGNSDSQFFVPTIGEDL